MAACHYCNSIIINNYLHCMHTVSMIINNCDFTDFPAQLVDPITAEGISTAGFSSYTLVCNTARESALQPSTTLAVQWLDPMGNVISSGANFSISGSGPTNDSFLTSRLTFSILYTSQAGEYTCRILQTIPGTVTNHTEDVSFTVIVKCEWCPY